jgi:restriction system protein
MRLLVIIVLVLLATLLLVIWRRRVARQAFDPRSLRQLEDENVRDLLAAAFARQGFMREDALPMDAQVQLVLHKQGQLCLVQCKYWRAEYVGPAALEELQAAMLSRGAQTGYCITTGRFTQEARQLAQGSRISLIEGPQLRELIQLA